MLTSNVICVESVRLARHLYFAQAQMLNVCIVEYVGWSIMLGEMKNCPHSCRFVSAW